MGEINKTSFADHAEAVRAAKKHGLHAGDVYREDGAWVFSVPEDNVAQND